MSQVSSPKTLCYSLNKIPHDLCGNFKVQCTRILLSYFLKNHTVHRLYDKMLLLKRFHFYANVYNGIDTIMGLLNSLNGAFPDASCQGRCFIIGDIHCDGV